MNGRFLVGVFGKAGSGKTHLIRELLVPASPSPVFILDTQNDFFAGVVFESARDLWEYVQEGRPNRTGVYTLKATSDEDYDTFFRMLHVGQIPGTVVLDEADLFCSVYKINEDLSRILKYGRHWKQNVIYAARRAAEVNRNLTAQSDCIVSFKQTEARDIATLRQSYEAAAGLPDLDETRHEYLVMGSSEHLPFHEIFTGRQVAHIVPNS